ncbi:MAG: prenyltransferase/squalene oxidase repeat-containing protein [Verrucomicrobiota bacterium]
MTDKTLGQKIKEHLWGPVGSLLFHVILVFLLIHFVQFIQHRDDAKIEVVMLETQDIEIEELLDDEIEELKDLSDVEEITMTDEPITMENTETETVSETTTEVDLQNLDLMSDIDSPVIMKGLLFGRTAIGRKAMLGKYAGRYGGLTEAAVRRALEWLKKNQNSDGSWNGGAKIGHTGLGLLTFLAHGETPDSKRYGATVEKAIKYLLSQCNDQHQFGIKGAGHGSVYEHCIGTYAISEAFGMTRVPALKDAMEGNLKVIIEGQQQGGGWDYHWDDKARTDTSVMGWAAQALKAGKIAGAQVEGLPEALKKAVPGFRAMAKPSTGKFGYTSPGNGDIGMTGVGVLCMQLLGAAKDPLTLKGLAAMEKTQASYVGTSRHPLYAYYYITQAKFHEGGSTWHNWNPKIATLLVKSQKKDGSWLPKEVEKRGPVYCTTLAALSLQVYYRFLPTFQTDAVLVAEPEVLADDADVMITVGGG